MLKKIIANNCERHNKLCTDNCGQDLPDNGWQLGERLLAYLWDDIFQRVVIYHWIFEKRAKINSENILCETTIEQAKSKIISFNHPKLTEEIKDNNASCSELVNKIKRDSHGEFPMPPFSSSDPQEGWIYLLKMMEVMIEDPFVTDDFKINRIIPLVEYFKPNNNCTFKPKTIPVYFLEGDGYDYILSNEGIELIIPGLPAFTTTEFRKLVYDLYIHRQTGQYALLVPPNFKCGLKDNRFDCNDKPTKDEERLRSLHTVRMNSGDNNVEEIQFSLFRYLGTFLDSSALFNGSLIAENAFSYIIRLIQCDLDQERSFLKRKLNNWEEVAVNIKEILEQQISWDNIGDHPIKSTIYEVLELDCSKFRTKENQTINCSSIYSSFSLLCMMFCAPLDINTYMFLRASTRCWQISGSIFRRIAHHLPRVKAEIWRNQLLNERLDVSIDSGIESELGAESSALRTKAKTAAKEKTAAISQEFENRYYSNKNEDCRSIFRERLEITLPDCKSMYFRGLEKSEEDDNWPGEELVIHEQGFMLPKICEGPDQLFLLRTWRNGSAANVTHTDSAKTC